jgi:DNA replication and repair protein RecF
MRINSLVLQNFRSYKALHIEVTEQNVQVFSGPNGVGKTNILEAIVLLSLTKSFQSREESDMITWDEAFYRLQATITTDAGMPCSVEVASQLEPRKKKAFYKDDIACKAGQLVGVLPTVQFFPQDLDLFTGTPARRRQFLDQLLCQVSPHYLQTLSTYQQVVKQRNALLKKINVGHASASQLPLWDQQIAELGAYITIDRLELIGLWQLTIGHELRQLGETFSEVEFVYKRKGTEQDKAVLTTELYQLLTEYAPRDILLQTTSIGPHRDDWYLQVDGHIFTSFASRGQQRAAVLALILLQTSYLELKRGDRPIILLDDVFSEFDERHQMALLEVMQQSQVFITSAITPPIIPGAAYWNVLPGAIALQ